MPPKSWFDNKDKISLFSKFIRDNNIVNFSDNEVINICLAIGIDPYKNIKGQYRYRKQVRMKYLEAKKYFEVYEIEKTSINYANYMQWKHAKYDGLEHRFAKKTFTNIENNIYIGVKEPIYEEEPGFCRCSETDRCKIRSLCCNKEALIECDEKCLFNDQCCNKTLQTRKFPPVEVFQLAYGHYGVRSASVINKDEIIAEYTGEVVNERGLKMRQKKYANDRCLYIFYFGEGLFIDAKFKGSIARYINHSCQPNSASYIVNSLGKRKMAIIATEVIPFGKEICFDYGNHTTRASSFIKCFCGSIKCKGRLPL